MEIVILSVPSGPEVILVAIFFLVILVGLYTLYWLFRYCLMKWWKRRYSVDSSKGHETTGREGTGRIGAIPTDPRDSRRVTELRRDATGPAASLSPMRGDRLPQA